MSEVRAAAERMRAWLALPEPKGVTDRYYDGGVGQYYIDSEILVNSYLAEHLADDYEPVNEAWLISIGFCCDQYGIVSASTGALCLAWFGKGDFGCDHVPFEAKTRGDVRRLCRALGVEVKE